MGRVDLVVRNRSGSAMSVIREMTPNAALEWVIEWVRAGGDFGNLVVEIVPHVDLDVPVPPLHPIDAMTPADDVPFVALPADIVAAIREVLP